MDLPNSRNKPLKTFQIVASLPKEFDVIVTHRSFSFKHIILCSIIYDFTMFIFCIYVSTIQFMFLTELKFSSCARAFVHPLFYFLCIGCASTRFKMFSEALPKVFNVKVRALFFIYIIFHRLQGKLPLYCSVGGR